MKNSLLLSLLLLSLPVFGDCEDRSNIQDKATTASAATVVKRNAAIKNTATILAANKIKVSDRKLAKGATGAAIGWHIGWWGTWAVQQAIGVTLGAAATATGVPGAGPVAYGAFVQGSANSTLLIARTMALAGGFFLGVLTGPTP